MGIGRLSGCINPGSEQTHLTILTYDPSLIELVRFGSTFAGNPLACACAIAAIDVLIAENLTARTHRLGLLVKERLNAIKSPYFGGWKGRGLFFSLYVRDGAPKGVTAKRWTRLLLDRGVLTQDYGDRIRLAPPLCIEESELWKAIDEIERCVDELWRLDSV